MSELAEAALRPRMRGLTHQYAFFVAVALGAALVSTAPGGRATVAAAIYAVAVCGLFGVSALYHRITWSASARRWMRRLDHSMIFVFIAASYTPVALLVLHGELAVSRGVRPRRRAVHGGGDHLRARTAEPVAARLRLPRDLPRARDRRRGDALRRHRVRGAAAGMSARYDEIGRTYTVTRRPDPRLAAAIDAALGDARTVVNVGAGTGAYEP